MYRNKIVRDLEQSIRSEFILNDELVLPKSFLEIDDVVVDEWLLKLDEDVSELVAFTQKFPSYRLGRYFESLLLYYFEFHPNIEVVEYGKQIFSGKRTIGEMDFILKKISTGETIHLEVALKYFAKVIGESDFYSYICSNGSRTFGEKLDKTYSKQLKLSEAPETIEYLKSINSFPIKSYHFIKGMLFYHISEIETFVNNNLNPAHQRGWWVFYKEVDLLSEKSRYKIIDKLKWLSVETIDDDSVIYAKDGLILELKNHFEIVSQGKMIVEFEDCNGIWKEKSRGFVLDNDWPNLKAQ